MITSVLAYLSHIVILIIESVQYLGIFSLMALESANIPIPSEIIMPFSGFLAQKRELSFWLVVIVGTLGNVFGSIISYYLAVWIVRIRAKIKIVRFFISDDFLDKSKEWFNKYGSWSVFFSRILPIVRTFISLPAGLGKMNILKFSSLTFAGSFIWSIFLTYVGWFLGQNWQSVEKYFRQFDILIVVLILIFGFWWAKRHFTNKKINF